MKHRKQVMKSLDKNRQRYDPICAIFLFSFSSISNFMSPQHDICKKMPNVKMTYK